MILIILSNKAGEKEYNLYQVKSNLSNSSWMEVLTEHDYKVESDKV